MPALHLRNRGEARHAGFLHDSGSGRDARFYDRRACGSPPAEYRRTLSLGTAGTGTAGAAAGRPGPIPRAPEGALPAAGAAHVL